MVALICAAVAFGCLGLGQCVWGNAECRVQSAEWQRAERQDKGKLQMADGRMAKGGAVMGQLAAPDPAHFTNWLVSAAAALSLAALGKQFIRKTPLETQFLTRKEFTEFREKLDLDLGGISGKIDRSHDVLSHRLDVLGARLDEVRSLVDRVDERTRGKRLRVEA